MKTMILVTFNDVEHAQPVVHRLEQAGLHPHLHDETNWQRRHFAETLASVKVEVDEDEYAEAKRKLRELDATDHCLDQSVSCPACGSSEVDYPQMTRKFVLPSLHAIFYQLGFAEKEFYCHACHHTWPTRLKLEPGRDALNWPIKNSPLRENSDTTP